MPQTAVVLIALLLLLGSLMGYLLQERSRLQGELADSGATLATATASLTEETNRAAALEAASSAIQAERDAKTASLNALGSKNAVLTENLTEAVVVQDKLRSELDEVAARLKDISTEMTALEITYESLAEVHDHLGETHSETVSAFESLTREHAELSQEHQELVALAGDLSMIREQIRQGEEEIERLKALRQPLILRNVESGWLLCTGSMEPKLTCLDRPVFVFDYHPEDVTVGSIINFQSATCWPEHSGWAAHRVAAIRHDQGIYYYWTQGDANEGPDNCWVPHTRVYGYLIDIKKNVVMENAPLRESVNAAKIAYVAAWAAYLDLMKANCDHRALDECTVYSGRDEEELSQAYQRALEARLLYDCWYESAAKSEYPGHIPHTC